VDAEFPCVPISLDHLRFARQGRVVAVLDVQITDVGLEVAAVSDAVRGVNDDCLHVPAEAFRSRRLVITTSE